MEITKNTTEHDKNNEKKKFDFLQLAIMYPPMDTILFYLSIPDIIYLAATCKALNNYIKNTPRMKAFAAIKSFNLDTFPSFVGASETISVFKTLPDTEVMILNLSFSFNHIFDRLRKFQNLKKLKIFLNDDDFNINTYKLKIESLTVRTMYQQARSDPLLSLLRQLTCIKRLSIHGGFLSLKSIDLIAQNKLHELKLNQVAIRGHKHLYFVKVLLQNKYLKKLSLVTDCFIFKPCSLIIIGDMINQLPKTPNLNIEDLCFTLDQHCRIHYQNLKLLTSLRKLKIFFNVQENILNFYNLLEILSDLKHVDIILEEYLETSIYTRINNFSIIRENSQTLSAHYTTLMKNAGNHITVNPVDYTTVIPRPFPLIL